MPFKRIPLLFILAGVLLVFALVWALDPSQTASAQCTKPSSCKTCHQVQGNLPYNADDTWHKDHNTIYDFCVDCHGGDRLATDAETAHAGLTTSLSAMQSSCNGCHSENCDGLLQIYAAAAGVTIQPSAQPSIQPQDTSGLGQYLGVQPAGAEPEPSGSVSTPPASASPAAQPPVNRTGNWILIGLIGLVSAGGGGYACWNERRLRLHAGSALQLSAVHPKSEPARPELATLLDRLNPESIESLESLLEDPALAGDLFDRLVDLDDETLQTLRTAKPDRIDQALKASRKSRH